MPFIFTFLFIVAIICVIVGFIKSSFRADRGPKWHCTICGWTKEQVQLCQFEQHHQTKIALLCFDCCIEHDGLPVREGTINTRRTVRV